ncbi:hypothetical protein EDB83DRAFT_2390068 [Lactarius deliciosus]|nr:hypothetical protein EDB83DRAFT_2390068 [Lactarius deliciosus]
MRGAQRGRVVGGGLTFCAVPALLRDTWGWPRAPLLIRSFPREWGATGWCVALAHLFPRERGVARTRGKGKGRERRGEVRRCALVRTASAQMGREGPGAACPRAPPFHANAGRRGERRGRAAGGIVGPLPRERGGADTRGKAAYPRALFILVCPRFARIGRRGQGAAPVSSLSACERAGVLSTRVG